LFSRIFFDTQACALAILHPTRAEWADALLRLTQAGIGGVEFPSFQADV
jgi:hypothetical protein